MADNNNASRLLRSPKTIRARLTYDPPPASPIQSNVTVRSSHQFLTDKYNPVPVSLPAASSYTRSVQIEESVKAVEDSPRANSPCLRVVDVNRIHQDALVDDQTLSSDPTNQVDNVADLKSGFVQRKVERDQCSKDFTEFLGSIATTNNASASHDYSLIAAVTDAEPTDILGVSKPAIHIIGIPPRIESTEPRNEPKVESKTVTLKLAPRENVIKVSHTKPQKSTIVTPKVTTSKAKPQSTSVHVDRQPTSQQKKVAVPVSRPKPPPLRQKSNIDIPLLNITSPVAKHPSGIVHTDRQQPSLQQLTNRSSNLGTSRTATFDSDRARKHMAEQMKKRRLAKNADPDGKIALAERKRRLADLQQQTRQIVQRNLTKNAAKCVRIANTILEQHYEDADADAAADEENGPPKLRPSINKTMQTRRGPDRGTIQFAYAEDTPHQIVSPSVVATAIAESSTVAAISTNANAQTKSVPANDSTHRRVGILRRTDTSPPNNTSRPPVPSPLNIHFDQLLSPGRLQTSNLSGMFGDSSPRPQSLQMPDVKLQTSTTIGDNRSKKTLQSTKTPPRTGGTVASDDASAAADVPYWLRPSPMQIYPYNFIMAVRKKLDLIANPTLSIGDAAKADNPSRSRHSYFKKMNNRVSGGLSKKSPDNKAPTNPPTAQHGLHAHAIATTKRDLVSDSDAITTLSSMSLLLPPSNSRSLKPPANQHARPTHSDSDSQATLSMSSAILSHSSPDKKKPPNRIAVEPLSTDAIAAMRLVSGATTATDSAIANKRPAAIALSSAFGHPFVNCRRGNAGQSSSKSHSSRRHWSGNGNGKSSSSSSSKSNAPITLDRSNIMDMLDSFNRSLSHAISVNQQLHDTLNRPAQQQSATGAAAESSAIASNKSAKDEYSSQFDSTTSSLPISAKAANASASTSMLENESGIPLTATTRDTITTESIPTDLSQITESARSKEVRPPPKAAKISTDSKTASPAAGIPTANTSSSVHSASSTKQTSSIVSCIRPQTDSDDISSVNTAARHFEQSYGAVPSVLSLDACNSLPAYASPLSTDRLLKPATTSPMLSSTSSTLTIKSMRIDSNLSVRNGHNKENMSGYSNGEKTERMMAETKRPAASADVEPDLNKSIGSDIFAVFNQTDIEFSSVLQTGNAIAHSSSTTTFVSEANISYASLGMYDRLLKTEDQKSLDLTALLKVREKALMDRTKGQIAWLELQKQKYQQRGLTAEISAVKKKQRALLLRLERDRAELTKSAKHSASIVTPSRPKHATVLRLSHLKAPTVRRSCSPSLLQHTQPDIAPPATPKSALRAFDFAADTNVEAMLQQRENRLRHRRAHVESLVRWHQRLDDEECAVAEMEAQLMVRTNQVSQRNNYQQQDSNPLTPRLTSNVRQQQQRQRRQIQNIEHRLEILHALPNNGQLPNDTTGEHSATMAADVSSLHGAASCDGIERVPVSGSKMNRLWRRLTGESGCKFIPDRRYELSKADIADVYEDAKRYVLGQFGDIGRRGGVQVLDQSMLSAMSATETIQQHSQSQPKQQRAEMTTNGPNVLVNTTHHPHAIAGDEFIVVPALNLNFTSTEEHSQSASDADGGGVGGVHDSYVSGFYFTDNVESMQQSDQHQPQQQLLLLNKESTEWDGHYQSTSANSLSKTSVNTFYIQPTNSTTFRDSAFSVDSLNSSRPEVSLAATLSMADDSQPSSIVEQQHTAKDTQETILDPNFDASMDDTSAEPKQENHLMEQTIYIDDISCPPQMMENLTASISEPTIAVGNIVRINNSTTVSAASEDNDQQQHNSYSDSFEPTATITATSSDKIAVSIELADMQQQVTINDGENESSRSISEAIETAEHTSGSVPMIVGDQQHTNRTEDADISSQDISECVSSFTVDSTITDQQRQSPPQTRSVDDKPVDSVPPTLSSVIEPTKTDQSVGVSQLQVAIVEHVDRPAEASPISPTYKMPDIISEAEVLRRQQIRIEEEIKQLEEENAAAAPFVYIREIPNKPPPPYVPPAHGSPMTAIFPSDARIQFIVFRRVKQLLDSSSTDTTIVEEHITNIYERIALDICAECLDELPPRSEERPNVNDAPLHFKHPLAFYNPPDRLHCMQQHVLQRVKKLLRHPHAPPKGGGGSHAGANSHTPTTTGGANDRNGHQLDVMETAEPAQQSINYVKRLLVGGGGNGSSQYTSSNNGAKRKLWWNEILLQEMMEDDATWTNFDAERIEVLDSVGEEIMRMLVAEALVECERSYERKAIARNRHQD